MNDMWLQFLCTVFEGVQRISKLPENSPLQPIADRCKAAIKAERPPSPSLFGHMKPSSPGKASPTRAGR